MLAEHRLVGHGSVLIKWLTGRSVIVLLLIGHLAGVQIGICAHWMRLSAWVEYTTVVVIATSSIAAGAMTVATAAAANTIWYMLLLLLRLLMILMMMMMMLLFLISTAARVVDHWLTVRVVSARLY